MEKKEQSNLGADQKPRNSTSVMAHLLPELVEAERLAVLELARSGAPTPHRDVRVDTTFDVAEIGATAQEGPVEAKPEESNLTRDDAGQEGENTGEESREYAEREERDNGERTRDDARPDELAAWEKARHENEQRAEAIRQVEASEQRQREAERREEREKLAEIAEARRASPSVPAADLLIPREDIPAPSLGAVPKRPLGKHARTWSLEEQQSKEAEKELLTYSSIPARLPFNNAVVMPVPRRELARRPGDNGYDVKLRGSKFGGLKEMPTDPRVDPPPYCCFKCWKRGHAATNCGRPQLRTYCFNFRRLDERLSQMR